MHFKRRMLWFDQKRKKNHSKIANFLCLFTTNSSRHNSLPVAFLRLLWDHLVHTQPPHPIFWTGVEIYPLFPVPSKTFSFSSHGPLCLGGIISLLRDKSCLKLLDEKFFSWLIWDAIFLNVIIAFCHYHSSCDWIAPDSLNGGPMILNASLNHAKWLYFITSLFWHHL